VAADPSGVRVSRAGNRRGRAGDQLGVELIAPRAELFGGSIDDTAVLASTGDPFGDGEKPRSGPAAYVALGIVVAFVTAAVVVAAPWRSSPQSSAPSTSARPTIPRTVPRPRPSTSADDASSGTTAPTVSQRFPEELPGSPAASSLPKYLLPFDSVTGETQIGLGAPLLTYGAVVGTDVRPQLGWLELWATPGSSRLTGSWFSVEITPGSSWLPSAERLDLGPRSVMRAAAPDGVPITQFHLDSWTVRIESFGWSDAALEDLASGIGVTTIGRPTYAHDSFRSDHAAVARTGTSGGDVVGVLVDGSVSVAAYSHDTGRAAVEVVTAAADAGRDALVPYALTLDPEATVSAARAVGATGVYLGTVADHPEYSVAVATLPDVTITVIGQLDSAGVLGLLPRLRVGTDTEWQALSQSDTSSQSVDTSNDDTDSRPEAIGTTAAGDTWTATVFDTGRFARLDLTPPTTSPRFVDSARLPVQQSGRPLQSLAGDTAVWVLCVLPKGQAPAVLHLRTSAGVRDVPFVATDDTGQVLAATTVFSELGDYQVDVETVGRPALHLSVAGAPSGGG
jgi:hypothetical protein